MTFTVQNIISSVAYCLQELYPGIPVYDSPTIDTDFPCFYVFLMNPGISDDIIPYAKREIPLDIVYVQQRNVPNANQAIHAVAETLDEALDMLTYTDGSEEDPVPLHTYNRSWSIEDQELHYKITLRQRVTLPRSDVLMQTLEEANVEVERGSTAV